MICEPQNKVEFIQLLDQLLNASDILLKEIEEIDRILTSKIYPINSMEQTHDII